MLGRKLAGRYSVVKPLAEGGFGETFLAEDTHLPDSPQCVVKKLKTGSHDPALLQTVRRLFDSEAKVLHQLGDHPQIPRLLAHFEDNEEFYLAEEFVEGESLAEELETGKPLDEDAVLQLLYDILEVLSFVHEKQVIHRDIKPSNLIRRRRDRKLVLIDFGAVKQVTTQLADTATQMPRTVLIGTSGYMPSEQFRGQPRLCSDIYAVGIIGIQALTRLRPSFGELPEDETTGELVWRDRVSVSPAFATLLEKMVFYDYRQRYRSATEALLAVQNLLAIRQTQQPSSFNPNIDSLAETVVNPGNSNFANPTQNQPNTSPTTAQQDNTAQQLQTIAQQAVTTPQSPPTTPQTPQTSPQLAVTTAPSGDLNLTTPQVTNNGSHPAQEKSSETVVASPKTSPHKIVRLTRTKLLTGSLVAVLIGGTSLALTSPYIQSVCTVLKNCSQDIQFQATYDQAVDDAQAAQITYKQAKTVANIQAAQEQLDTAIAELNKIPRNIKVYPQAKRALATYQNESKTLSTRIQKEIKADESLKKANKIAQTIQKSAKNNDSVSTLDQHKAEWQKALKLLQEVPKDSFLASQVEAKRKDFSKQLTSLEEQRQKTIAAAAQAQRQMEAEQAAPIPAESAPREAYVPPPRQETTYVPPSEPAPAPAPVPAPAPQTQEPLWGPGSSQSSKEPLWGPGSR
ncbi:MAG: protein kinase [Acaryochloris sp. RU_4_1]|nr:protein kinase [Acaryochloris sp. RU_4_1]NJR53971.1 protein kinase [Acaryochloris sp. CRU_2_0]